MKKNVAGQVVGIGMVTASTLAAFAGTVTCYVTGDGGTQALGSVGSGVCTNEGNGAYTYTPSQAETNYDHILFTFIGTLAKPETLNVYTDNDGLSGLVDYGTAQSATSTTLVLRSAAAFANSELIGATLVVTGGTGVGQSRVITGYVGSTDTATVDAWTTTPSGTITYAIFASAPASATLLPATNATQLAGQTVTAASGVTFPSSVASPTNITAGTMTTTTNVTTISAGGITASSIATDAIGAAELASDAVTEIAGAVWDLATSGHTTASTFGAQVKTLLDLIATYIDTEVAAIKAKTDNLPSDPADASDIATLITALTATVNTSRYQKNAIAADIPVVMVDNTDHVTRKTGLTLAVTRSIDGGAFGSATGTAAEVANGVYMFDASAADMNGNNIVLRFAGTAADPVELHIKTYT